MAEFTHHLSRKQYADGLRAELSTATSKEHRAAVQAELEALAAETPAPAAGEQA